MSFAPVVPARGVAGWAFLNRTMAVQKRAFLADSSLTRDEDYFRAKIGAVKTAGALVDDRRLLTVALTAFGLEGEVNNKALLRKVLEDGTVDPDALANRFADKRYLEFSRAFGFGDFAVPNTGLSDFADGIIARYEGRRFEAAVGDQNPDMRLALNAQRELGDLAGRDLSANGRWFTALGSVPLRTVLQTALGLPKGFAQIDIDKQVTILKDRAERQLGSADLAVLADPEKMEGLIRKFLVRSELQAQAAGSGGSAALALIQQARRGGASSAGRLSRYV